MTASRRRVFFAPVLLMSVACARGQQPVPTAAGLRPGTDTMSMFVINGFDTTTTGFVIDELAMVEREGRKTIRRVYRSQDRILGVRVDTIFDDAVSLKPIATRSRTSGTREVMDFRNDRAAGWLMMPNGDTIAVDVPMPADAYGASSFDLVVRNAPLADGWKAIIPSFVASTRSVIPMSARVAGVDDVDGTPAWRIQAEVAGMPVTFWVDKETRRLARQIMQISPSVTILIARPRLPSTPGRRTST